MKTTLETFPETLRELYSHPDFIPFGSSSDDWIGDAERMERCHIAAEEGEDGSFHGETIQDWRSFLASLEVDALRSAETEDEETRIENLAAAISEEIDACEAYHESAGTLWSN